MYEQRNFEYNQEKNEEAQEDLRPLKGYKQQNQKQQTYQICYNDRLEQMNGYQANQGSIKQQNFYNSGNHYHFNKNQYNEKQNNFYQNDNQCYQRYYQSREEIQMKKSQEHQQYNYNYNTNYEPQQQSICYQFKTQFLRANNYLDIKELRSNFKALRDLNKDHLPSSDSHFVLIRPRPGLWNIHKAIKYGIWCSTPSVNSLLQSLYSEKSKSVYLIFFPFGQNSQLIGIAQMTSDFNLNKSYSFWDYEGIYRGLFELTWHYIKYVDPNFIEQISMGFGIEGVQYMKDGTYIPYKMAQGIFELFQQASDNPSVFESFNGLDLQEDQRRNNKKLKDQEKEEMLQKQQGLKKKYLY